MAGGTPISGNPHFQTWTTWTTWATSENPPQLQDDPPPRGAARAPSIRTSSELSLPAAEKKTPMAGQKDQGWEDLEGSGR